MVTHWDPDYCTGHGTAVNRSGIKRCQLQEEEIWVSPTTLRWCFLHASFPVNVPPPLPTDCLDLSQLREKRKSYSFSGHMLSSPGDSPAQHTFTATQGEPHHCPRRVKSEPAMPYWVWFMFTSQWTQHCKYLCILPSCLLQERTPQRRPLKDLCFSGWPLSVTLSSSDSLQHAVTRCFSFPLCLPTLYDLGHIFFGPQFAIC